MSLSDFVESVPRKTMTLFFIIDTSGSMSGDKIGAVNTAIEEILPEIRDMSGTNADAKIKIAALEFSSGAEWITTSGPVEAETFTWTFLNAGGVTDLGDACIKLNEKLSKNEFMKETAGSFAPALFLMSDGEPTDDYQKGLTLLKQNNWFKKAIKVAVAIGEDANKEVLTEFTGTSEAVHEAYNIALLKKMIKFVSIRASQLASKSSNVGIPGNNGARVVSNKQDDFIDELEDFKNEIENDSSDKDIEW